MAGECWLFEGCFGIFIYLKNLKLGKNNLSKAKLFFVKVVKFLNECFLKFVSRKQFPNFFSKRSNGRNKVSSLVKLFLISPLSKLIKAILQQLIFKIFLQSQRAAHFWNLTDFFFAFLTTSSSVVADSHTRLFALLFIIPCSKFTWLIMRESY